MVLVVGEESSEESYEAEGAPQTVFDNAVTCTPDVLSQVRARGSDQGFRLKP